MYIFFLKFAYPCVSGGAAHGIAIHVKSLSPTSFQCYIHKTIYLIPIEIMCFALSTICRRMSRIVCRALLQAGQRVGRLPSRCLAIQPARYDIFNHFHVGLLVDVPKCLTRKIRRLTFAFFSYFLKPGFRIRIRIGSVFNRASGSGSGFGIRIRIQEGKNDPQK